jgi:CheY-like chemotaxis protein/HPt (histidine-containing phosphotransfer) domain-containing protein
MTKPVRQSDLYDCLATMIGTSDSTDTKGARPNDRRWGDTVRHPTATLLVAEDNTVNQQVARYMLEAQGYRVDVVANGREAVAALERRAYAAVLMDIQMPEMDGFAATAAIRTREGAAQHTPIIALTAHAMHGEREKCLAVGMDDYLAKPIMPQVIDAVLRRWVARAAQALEPGAMAAPEVATDAALDQTVRANLRRLEATSGKPIRAQLLASFAAGTPRRLTALRDAIAARDGAAVNREAHTLRGSSANMGAWRMAQLCGDLETLSKTDDLTYTASILASIEAEYKCVHVALEQESTKI